MFHRLPLDPHSLGEQVLAKMSRLTLTFDKFQDEAGETCIAANYKVEGDLSDAPDSEFMADLLAAFGQERG